MRRNTLVQRVEALEEKAALKTPCRQPERHVIHGATRQERERAAQLMIARGQAEIDDVFFMVIPAGGAAD